MQAEGKAAADWLMCLYDLRGWLLRGSCRVHKAACLQTFSLPLSFNCAFIICLCVMSEELKLEILSGKIDFFLLFRSFFFKRHKTAAELTGLLYFCLLLFIFDWWLFHELVIRHLIFPAWKYQRQDDLLPEQWLIFIFTRAKCNLMCLLLYLN